MLFPKHIELYPIMKKVFTALLFPLLSSYYASSQDYLKQAQNHFSQYLNSHDFVHLMTESLPTLDECQMVFKEEAALEYHAFVETMKAKAEEELKTEPELFVDVRIEVFSTQDIEQQKGNYAGGMQGILDKLQPYVIFHKVSLLREKGAAYGVAYKYWVNINGRWVFFLKPYRAFG